MQNVNAGKETVIDVKSEYKKPSKLAPPNYDDKQSPHAEILKLYVGQNPDTIDDPLLSEYVMDRRRYKQKSSGFAAEMKSFIDKMQRAAAELQIKIADTNGAIKYVDSKIIQRHHELLKANG